MKRSRPRSSRLFPLVPCLLGGAVLVLAACAEPLLTIPGGELAGEVVAVPADWAFTDDISTVQIETNPADPYSVNIWAVGVGPHLYLHAGASRTTWVEHLEADPRLRVRVDQSLYELASTRVTEAEEFARFADAYEAKYDRRPGNENVAEVYLLRLAAR